MIRDSCLDDINYNRHKIFKRLDEMEDDWNLQQNLIYDEIIKESEQTQQKEAMRKDKLFDVCQAHGGPFQSVQKMMEVIETMNEVEKKHILRVEIIYKKKTNFHKNLDYGVNKRTIHQLIETMNTLIFYESKEPSFTEEIVIDPCVVLNELLNKL